MSNSRLNSILGAALDEEQLTKISGGTDNVIDCPGNGDNCTGINKGGAICSTNRDHSCATFAITFGPKN